MQYICYPWSNPTEYLPPDLQKPLCIGDTDCPEGHECFRHNDRRAVRKGICFDNVSECANTTDCFNGFSCCGGYCCEHEYYAEFQELPCVSDFGCVEIGLGEFCCPKMAANGTRIGNVCCDEDPNERRSTTTTSTTEVATTTEAPSPNILEKIWNFIKEKWNDFFGDDEPAYVYFPPPSPYDGAGEGEGVSNAKGKNVLLRT